MGYDMGRDAICQQPLTNVDGFPEERRCSDVVLAQKATRLTIGPRYRNAAATRQAILEAAKTCFMHEGYEQVGVRDIAARAGVDPALVNRYFGSKEGLFSEAVASKFDLSHLLDGDRATLGERLARYVLQKKSTGADYDPLVALLRSSSSDVVAECCETQFWKVLSAR